MANASPLPSKGDSMLANNDKVLANSDKVQAIDGRKQFLANIFVPPGTAVSLEIFLTKSLYFSIYREASLWFQG